MSQQSSRQEVAKRYLLGTLSNAESDQLEQRYFSDTAVFDEIEMVEDDLVDEYVRGKLTGDDRRRFEIVAFSSPRLLERVEFAKLLSQKTAALSKPTELEIPQRNRWRELFFGRPARFAFGLGILPVILGGLLVFGVWLQVRQRSEAIAAREASLQEQRLQIERQAAESKQLNEQWAGQLRAQEEQLKAREQHTQDEIKGPDESALGVVASLFLQPGTTRGGGRSSELNVTQNTSRIRFRLDLADSDSRRYRATILTAELKAISKPRLLTGRKTRSGNFLIVEIPAKDLSPGDYFVRVEGLAASGETESVNDYQFRLNRANP